MDFSRFMDGIVSFAQSHTVIVIVLALVLLYFMYLKPKVFIGILVLGLFLAGLIYLIKSIAGSGLEQKKELIYEEQKQLDHIR